VFSLPRLKA
jgi:hypothetical protein